MKNKEKIFIVIYVLNLCMREKHFTNECEANTFSKEVNGSVIPILTKKTNNMTVQEKARKSFNYQCKQASKCRHEKHQISCESCPQKNSCCIQAVIEKTRAKMY